MKLQDKIKEISNGRIELVKFNGSFSKSEASVFKDNKVNMLFKRNYVSEYSCLKRDPNASPFNPIIKLNNRLIKATNGLMRINEDTMSKFGEKNNYKKQILTINCDICNSYHEIKGDALCTRIYNLNKGKKTKLCDKMQSLSHEDFVELSKKNN